MFKHNEKCYLGDGVYVEVMSDDTVVLTTSDGMRDTNTIYLDLETHAAFEQFIAKMRKRADK